MLPLPSSGAALSAAFYSPEPLPQNIGERTAMKARIAVTQRHLTRSFMQGDENCQESSDLHPLLGSIFAYSNRCIAQPTRASETAAGFRYFLPNGRLAHEWVTFWDIAPARYLGMAPSDVKQAYFNERELTPCSMKGWVEATIKRQQFQEADTMSQELVLDRISPYPSESPRHDSMNMGMPKPQTSLGKRKLEVSMAKDEHDLDHKIDPRLRSPEAKRPRLDVRQQSPFIIASPRQPPANPRHWLRKTPRGVPSPSPLAMSSRPSVIARTRAAQSARQAVVAAPPLQRTGRPQTQQAVPAQQTPPAQQVPPLYQGPAAQPNQPGQHPQPVVNRPPIPRHRQARNFPAHTIVPGSVQHIGQGNVSKAWSSERVRAFTDIQGYPANELPVTAVAQHGDEMSRGHTPKSIDPRHCPFDTTIEELITVRSHMMIRTM
jgi:hypothetical protein